MAAGKAKRRDKRDRFTAEPSPELMDIGTQNPQCEYIHDEPVIEKVFCFHIYEKKS